MSKRANAGDLRYKVEEDRGLIKKIELAIPGFRGYRKREDLRIADSLLRKQLADCFGNVRLKIEGCRDIMSKKMMLAELKDMADLIDQMTTIENKVRHAEQGYSGISADFRINIKELNSLYEWDVKLLDHIETIRTLSEKIRGAIEGDGDFVDLTRKLEVAIGQFNETFDQRIETIAGLI